MMWIVHVASTAPGGAIIVSQEVTQQELEDEIYPLLETIGDRPEHTAFRRRRFEKEGPR